MPTDKREQFETERERLNQLVLEQGDVVTKRFFHLDWQAYRAGALPEKTKELLGLIASLVLRCDDCIQYHLHRCRAVDVEDAELAEAVSIGLLVGGSITIPHIRRLWALWAEDETR